MPEEQSKPSTSGKVSAGIAATIVGATTYAAYKHSATPKPAQTSTKVPSSASAPPRGAAPSATSNASYYSTRAKASVGMQNLENSYRMGAQAAKGEGATGLLGAAQRALKGATGVAAWVGKGLTAKTFATAALWLGVSEGLFTRGTLDGADEALALSRARQKQLGLLQPAESKEVQAATYPFTGGQGDGVLYRVRAVTTLTYANGAVEPGEHYLLAWGAINSINFVKTKHQRYPDIGVALVAQCRGGYNPGGYFYRRPSIEFQSPQSVGEAQWFLGQVTNATPALVSVSVERLDGLPDTGGNPPPTTEPTYSTGAAILMALDPNYPAVGEVESPPPALISRSGDFLYDGARAPLQRVLDGTDAPWKENPVARMPGFSSVPAAPAPTDDVPQPQVADPIPSTNSETSRRYWDAQGPDLTPSTGVTPGTLAPVAPTPAAVTPSTGVKPETTPDAIARTTKKTTTQFNYNTPDRSPQPDTKTTPETTPETTPKADPNSDFDGWWTTVGLAGIGALLSPKYNPQLFTDIETTTQKATCQSLNGGCSTGININQQISNAASNSAAANTVLQAADLAAIGVINEKLGPQIPGGGISGFIQRVARFTRIDKIINALTLITALHNASMLSRSLASTLGDVTSTALSAIGIKDENGSPLDINAEMSKQANTLMSQLLGADVWAGTKSNWNKANRIISSATQIMSTVRSIADSGREVTEWIANNTGKIGNALKRFRVVGENAYPHMSENVTHQNAWMLKVQKYREGVDSLDDAASSLQGVLGEVTNIQQEAQELTEQKQRFDAAVKDATPKSIPDNKPVKDKADITKTASASPSTQADVFRGEGESNNA